MTKKKGRIKCAPKSLKTTKNKPKTKQKAKPKVTKKPKQYKLSKVERYYGEQKAYIFHSKNSAKNRYFSEVFSVKNKADMDRLFKSLVKKVLKSPLRYTHVNSVHLAVEGVARITKPSVKDFEEDDANEFPFWKASVESMPSCNKKLFFISLDARKKSLRTKLDDFLSGEMEYASEGSSRAEEYYIESMRIYAELPKQNVKATPKTKRKKATKNSSSRSRNKLNRK